MSIQKLAESAHSVGKLSDRVRVLNEGIIKDTLKCIISKEDAETLLICGSFYIMEEAFNSLGLQISSESENLLP
jgi:hypothetical protein